MSFQRKKTKVSSGMTTTIMWRNFEHFQTLRTWPYLGSTPKGVLHTKKYKNIKIVKQIDQYLQTSSICNPSKNFTKPTYNIKTKTNNTMLTTNPNSYVKTTLA